MIPLNDLKRLALEEGLSLRYENERFYLKCIDGKTNFDNVYVHRQDVVKDMLNYGKDDE